MRITKYAEVEVEVEIDEDDIAEIIEDRLERIKSDNEHEYDRETDFRRDLYRAIFAGNVEEAENIANLMAMVGIDRDLIWEARK